MKEKMARLQASLTARLTHLMSDLKSEDGMATVEYAIMIVAVSGFAGLMVLLLKSDWAKDMLQSIIEGAVGGE